MRRILAMAVAMIMVISCAAMAEVFEVAVDQKIEEKEWENILLMGGDTRNMNSEAYGRTDSMIILSINREESLVKMTSIMRDTWVEFPGTGLSHKINAGNVFGGPELAVKTVNTYFGTDIEDYVIINMEDMGRIVDLMGGVDVETTSAERSKLEGVYVNAEGLTHMNGEQAVDFSRIRKIDSDYSRVMRQQSVLLAMARKAQDMEVDALMDIAGEVSEIITSNLEKEELRELATAFMVMEIEEVEQFRIPVDGTFQSGIFNGVWMIRPDFEQNKTLLKEFIYGE